MGKTQSRTTRRYAQRVTLTPEEKARAKKIAPTMSWKKQIQGCAVRAASAKRRRQSKKAEDYDFGLSNDDIERMRESFE